MLKLSNKSWKSVQTAAVAALALSQCWMLTACGNKAMLARAAADKLAAKKQQNATNQLKQSGSPTPNASPTAPTDVTLASSLEDIKLHIDTKNDQVLFSFTSLTTVNDKVGPMIAKISLAAASKGADLTPPPDKVLSYTAHIACQKADCSVADITLSKHSAQSTEQAIIHIRQAMVSNLEIEAAGKLSDIETNIESALRHPGNIETQSTITRVEHGATYFKIDCRVALAPGKPADDSSPRVVLKGQTGKQTKVSVTYYSSPAADLKTGSQDNIPDATVTYTESDNTIRINVSGDNKIQSMIFGDTRVL